MVELVDQSGDYVEMKVDGKVMHEDYKKLGPEIEDVVEKHGPISMLVDIVDLDSFEPRTIIDDLKFDIRNATDIKRCAVVGDALWEKVLTVLYKPFVPKGEVKFFESSERAAARAWAGVDQRTAA